MKLKNIVSGLALAAMVVTSQAALADPVYMIAQIGVADQDKFFQPVRRRCISFVNGKRRKNLGRHTHPSAIGGGMVWQLDRYHRIFVARGCRQLVHIR